MTTSTAQREHVNAFIDVGVRRELERLAREADRSLSAEIRRALAAHVERETTDEGGVWMDLPTGRKLEQHGDPNYQGTIGPLRRADEQVSNWHVATFVRFLKTASRATGNSSLKWWTAADWEAWEKEGRPKVPRERANRALRNDASL